MTFIAQECSLMISGSYWTRGGREQTSGVEVGL